MIAPDGCLIKRDWRLFFNRLTELTPHFVAHDSSRLRPGTDSCYAFKMKSKTRRTESGKLTAVIRKRNQLTLPKELVDHLDIRVGDVVVIELHHGFASMRPVRRSYAGIAKGVYGDASKYVSSERTNWH